MRCLVVNLLLLAPSPLLGQPAPPRKPVHEIAGSLVLAGGGPIPESVYDAFVKLAGGPKARLVILPTAGEEADDKDQDKLVDRWKKRGADSVVLRSGEKANEPEFLRSLADATGVWLGGGDPAELASAHRGIAELRKLLERGGVVGGTAAGAAAMSQVMLPGAKVPARLSAGLGFLPAGIVEPHFLKGDRMNRLVDALTKNPGWFGLGIDEGTAVLVQGRTMYVMGQSYVVACLAAGKDRPVSCRVLRPGDRTDLIALSRAALARTQEPHPALKPPIPHVAKGALIIGGGGDLDDSIWNKFIDLAGGPGAKIVCIRTAQEDPTKDTPGEKRLKKMAGRNVMTMHSKSRAEAESPQFLKVLHEAKGIWFTGGRQWRLVDAYQDTAAEKAFHDVLSRGGVIGGSSAGASIQADYMVRGDPLGNLNIIAEGYERGLGFLKGVAIDQYFLKRKRTADMTELMARYPQLLGIGIDESTALYVHGEIMEVMGKSKVLVYDRSKRASGAWDYDVLSPGSRYNLRTRTLVKEESVP
jgi:cyanophycinase